MACSARTNVTLSITFSDALVSPAFNVVFIALSSSLSRPDNAAFNSLTSLSLKSNFISAHYSAIGGFRKSSCTGDSSRILFLYKKAYYYYYSQRLINRLTQKYGSVVTPHFLHPVDKRHFAVDISRKNVNKSSVFVYNLLRELLTTSYYATPPGTRQR